LVQKTGSSFSLIMNTMVFSMPLWQKYDVK